MGYGACVSPYRAAVANIATLEIGSRRDLRVRIALAAVLLLAAIASVAIAVRAGGGIIAWAPGPLLFGAIFLARTRHCRIEVSRGEHEVRVVVARLGPTVRARLAFEELESVHVVPSSMRVEKPNYVLQIGRAHAGSITLLHSETEAELHTERARVERFLIDAGAMDDRGSRVTVEDAENRAPSPEADVADERDESADTSRDAAPRGAKRG